MKNNTLANTARIVDRILKILQGFLIAGVIVCAVFIPLIAIFGEKMISSADTLDMDCVRITFRGNFEDYLDSDRLKLCLIAMLASTILALAAGWYCLRVLRQVLVPMKQGEPFAAGISGLLRKLGWTVLVGGFLVEAGLRLSEIFYLRAYRVAELFNHPSVESVRVAGNTPVHPWFLYAGLLLFFLSFVFRYGEELQKESDETL